MSRLYSIGELLIDFQSVGTGSLKTTEQFVKKAGGAPANVCAQAVKLGAKATYLTKVGDDGFGEFLIETLQDAGIDTSFVSRDKGHNTSLAFVSFQENGEREFRFYRKHAADLCMNEKDFEGVRFEKGDILEFGSVALASEEARKTHRGLIERAKKADAIIAFDPNLRFGLWEDLDELRDVVNEFLIHADVMKVGRDELEFISKLPAEIAAENLMKGNLKILLLTDGANGADLYVKDKKFHCPGYKVKSVDTTGAGDSFFGAFLALLLNKGIGRGKLESEENDFQGMLNFSCKAGAHTTMSFGAIQAMGDLENIERKVK